MNKYCKLLLPALAAGGTLLADVKLPAVFSDHAVLQKSAKTAVFGTADPGEKQTFFHVSGNQLWPE